MDTVDKEKSSKNAQILKTMLERFKRSEEFFVDIRKEALDDSKFRAGEQWPADISALRNIEKRPCLTINRLPQYVKQITNEQRQNRMAIAVHPVDDKGDPETAKVIQGIIQHIEKDSRADHAYDTAFEHCVSMSFGYIRIITEYVNTTSFDQKLVIKRVPNPFSVYLDPDSTENDGSDLEWGFVVENFSKEKFQRQHPKADLTSINDWTSVSTSPGWIQDDSVRIAEYFYKEYVEKRLVMLKTGEIGFSDKKGLEVLTERMVRIPVVHWCKTNGLEILESTIWPGDFIPIVPVYGDEVIVNGKRGFESIYRHAKDSQRMYNYWATAETEMIALAPKAPWIGAEGQFEGLESKWQQANTKSFAYLEYRPVSLAGIAAPPPQRNIQEPPISAITVARQHASEDIKATTGIYDAGMGASGNERSGKAIMARAHQGQVSNFHFLDNFTKSLRQVGRILINALPKVYNKTSVLRIMGEDDESRVIQVSGSSVEKSPASSGVEKIYDLSLGAYDIISDSGPNYASRRHQALENIIQLTNNYPKLFDVIGDLLVKHMNWSGASDISARLRKLVPPHLLETTNKEQTPESLNAMVQQQNQLIQQLTQALNETQEVLEKKKLELDSKEKIASDKIKLALLELMVNNDSADDRTLLSSMLSRLAAQEQADRNPPASPPQTASVAAPPEEVMAAA